MSKSITNPAELDPGQTSLAARMLNLFVSPGLVFDEVAASPFKLSNWLGPTLLVMVGSLLVLRLTASPQFPEKPVETIASSASQTATQAGPLSGHSGAISVLVVCLAAISGSLWSAFVLWALGRVVLRSKVHLSKALEVVGLSGTILILASITTALLVLATGDPSARPALSLFWPNLEPDSPWRGILHTLNVFHVWTVGVLAAGLAKISQVSTVEAAFCVGGFWIFGRIALAILA